MSPENAQVLFFQHVKSRLQPHLALVEETADLLNISHDSAYRRIRGEKPISFEEIRKLCSHFKISLDQFLNLEKDAIIFSGQYGDNNLFNFEKYLESVLQNVQLMNSFETREMYYLNKDIPIFHYFHFPELAAFKCFFWMKTVLHYPLYANKQFRMEEFITETILQTGQKLSEAYYALSSQEIWNIENINSTIRQIEYYRNSGVFASPRDIFVIYESLQKTIDHIEHQAELGYKFGINHTMGTRNATYKIYINEFILGDNTILAVLGNVKIAYVNHSVLNYLVTRDPEFCEYTYRHIRNIITKSTLISEAGEKERRRFFNMIREKINARKNSLL